ncbi:MAG: 3-hydroxy-3-methylglutaryl-CoA reductase [Candidatus Nanoarchaeia archaeon]|nr:3-hydroxy-3-methylglutaryl-CoA reductase [Candidatus Haiyanarchaeum thermophilum]MCW1304144.1 3-hydroxy-3-methylglutaryl-CoA reductase [Candidatus Haiyanarchaeum thermophilum]MCW1306896.1 3-hydroxy-3-methylglutaryl-CoA reductase [Candidatus Haiyanarchaeum thermophilum]MCW1307595.1 3-hydroxy-3-methylglutaryl-CoA reductase [Candidatus Haiyanarchaeum thermophilum]MCW1308302.1 3-hydroxy-3-methylglutaryl-CoA reductase [Candidatus Haiyanarchaeum thermophilum]
MDSKFYNLSILERFKVIAEHYRPSLETIVALKRENFPSWVELERLGENPIGTYDLPLRFANYFSINGRYFYLPYVIEESSVVAGACYGAKVTGNIEAKVLKSWAKSQIQFFGIKEPEKAKEKILKMKEEILDLANRGHRHSKAYDLGIKEYMLGEKCLILDLYVDPGDAMGAAVASEMAESIAPKISEAIEAKFNGRIISNYSGRLTKAKARIPVERLERKLDDGTKWNGEEVKDRIILLSRWAEEDVDRAVTHNKGIMNGVDAVALAFCQDWRAIEAANHAHACREGKYKPLSRWYEENGYLVGEAELLLPCGIVGGEIKNFGKAKALIELLGIRRSDELAEIMAAAGLANNFAALSMLATIGIGRGHKVFRK